MPIYAAYGTNLDPAQMQTRCPHSPVRGPGWLSGWRLTFGGEELGWEGALPTLVEDELASVFVLLYDITDSDATSLDSWEGADSGVYTKIRVRVSSLDDDVLAWTYVLNGFEGGLPSSRQLGLLADAAEAAGAPRDYVDELRNRPGKSLGA